MGPFDPGDYRLPDARGPVDLRLAGLTLIADLRTSAHLGLGAHLLCRTQRARLAFRSGENRLDGTPPSIQGRDTAGVRSGAVAPYYCQLRGWSVPDLGGLRRSGRNKCDVMDFAGVDDGCQVDAQVFGP